MDLTFRRSYDGSRLAFPWELFVDLTMQPAHVALLEEYGADKHLLYATDLQVVTLADALGGTSVLAYGVVGMMELEQQFRDAVEAVPLIIEYLHAVGEQCAKTWQDPPVTAQDQHLLGDRAARAQQEGREALADELRELQLDDLPPRDPTIPLPPSGYYPDPFKPGEVLKRRWWDGGAWTTQTDPEAQPGERTASAEILVRLPPPTARR